MVDVVWGTSRTKPEASRQLASLLGPLPNVAGTLYIGYPVMGSPLGPVRFDALLVSPQLGVVAFDLVEGLDLGDYRSRQDEIASMLEVKLKPYPDLKIGRSLKFSINVITFAPAKGAALPQNEPPYFLATSNTLAGVLPAFQWNSDLPTFRQLLAAVQVVTSIRSGKQKREPQKPHSKGAKLKAVEDTIANLDQRQSQAVIETVEGVQRIRGLAGSGKTIILALKVAYLHAQNENWRIAVTFYSRALKDQFRRLINAFVIEHTGSEPDWEQIDILNSWGGPGDKERDGIYHKYCRLNSIPHIDLTTAKASFGDGNEFAGVCATAITAAPNGVPHYDLILVDEAQDFSPEFLRLCYRFLSEPKRLVYAYDELQTLSGQSMLPPEELFGNDKDGEPLVRLPNEEGPGPKQDIILEKCYRNSRPLLATAHALGFGIYRDKGLVQIFDNDNLWNEVGYVVDAGELEPGKSVSLARTTETSPSFLEDHSLIDDLIVFKRFESAEEQAQWLAQSVVNDVVDQELRPDDIVVINPNPLTTKNEVARARVLILQQGINSELAGVSTSADAFVKSGSVMFTGIYRAKGNEAGMVYIMNAQDCYASWSAQSLAIVRNRLFTAITRSKAWVRILGIGPKMDGLIAEWSQLRQNDFKLTFNYPTEVDKQKLRVINKENPLSRRRRRKRDQDPSLDLLNAVEDGSIDPDELIQELNRIKVRRGRK